MVRATPPAAEAAGRAQAPSFVAVVAVPVTKRAPVPIPIPSTVAAEVRRLIGEGYSVAHDASYSG
jgi:hypothetical protein